MVSGKPEQAGRGVASGGTPTPEPGHKSGLVVCTHGHSVTVENPRSGTVQCAVRRKLGRIVCGDRVHWKPATKGQGVVTRILPRSTLIERHDALGRSRPLAANVDQIFVVTATQPLMEQGLVDRYLVAAELIGAAPVLLFHKADMLDATGRGQAENQLKEFMEIGYPVIFSSTVSPGGQRELEQHLHGHTSILVGQSGVGKSSIVKTLLPAHDIRIGHLSQASGGGRHTTSTTTLYCLSRNSYLIDSPGVRSFQLWHVEPGEVARGFREFSPWLGQCRFHNCQHDAEPGCAIRGAVKKGHITSRRHTSYCEIVQQLRRDT